HRRARARPRHRGARDVEDLPALPQGRGGEQTPPLSRVSHAGEHPDRGRPPPMGLEFLARIRRTSLVTGAGLALLSATYVTPATGLAVALGVAWSLVNLALVQALVVALTGPERRLGP